MSVVSGETRRRWGAVAVAVAALVCVPIAVTRLASSAASSASDPRQLLDQARGSQDVAYTGLATSGGNLGLPDLPSVSSATSALGGVTRTRTWWAGPDQWRVALLDETGEQDIYGRGNRTYLWDYEENTLTRVDGVPELRLPRADDLTPPQATRRILAGVSAKDSLQTIGTRRIAGVPAQGIRIRPSDTRSTIGSIDVWIEPRTGLPVAYAVRDARGAQALESHFDELDLATPASTLINVPRSRGMHFQRTPAPDLASRINQFGGVRLPDTLAGFAATAPIFSGTATYGSGLVRFTVLPFSERNANDWWTAARSGAAEDRALTGGEALRISTSALNLVVARAATGRTYAIAGLVDPSILFSAAQQLFTDPPGTRGAFTYS